MKRTQLFATAAALAVGLTLAACQQSETTKTEPAADAGTAADTNVTVTTPAVPPADVTVTPPDVTVTTPPDGATTKETTTTTTTVPGVGSATTTTVEKK